MVIRKEAIWIPISRDADGFATRETIRNILTNIPFFLLNNDGCEDLYYRLDNDINKIKYTHWRPLNKK